MRLPCALACICATFLATAVHAQVKPDLDWRTFRTPHFRVIFSPGLDALALRAADNAEHAYELLAKELVAPRGTIDLVLADNVDFANGFASYHPTNRIVLYARPPVDVPALRAHADWNAMLITHELAHIFHLDRSRGWWRLAQRVFGRAAPLFPNSYAPSWVIEGFAVHYESRLSEGGRLAGTEFAALVRAAALGGTLPSVDGLSQSRPHFPGAQGPYAFGAQLFAGRDAAGMRRYVEASSGRFLPWHLDGNARRAFGEGFSDRWSAIRDSVARDVAAEPRAEGETLTHHGWEARFPRFVSDSELVYVAYDARRSPGLYRVDLAGDRERIGRRNGIDMNAPTGVDETVRGELDYSDPYSVRSDLVGPKGSITHGARLSQPDVHRASGRIVAVRSEVGTTSLVVLELTGEGEAGGRGDVGEAGSAHEPRTLAAGTLDRNWTEPRWSGGGRYVAASRWERGGRSTIVVLDASTGAPVRSFASTRPFTVMASPAWLPGDSLIVFVSDHEGRAVLYAGDIRTGGIAPLWRSATALATPDVSPDGRRIAAVDLRGDGYHVVVREMPARLAFEPPTAGANETGDDVPQGPAREEGFERYSGFAQLQASWWLPTFEESDAGSWRAGGFTSARDPVGRHSYDFSVGIDLEHPEQSIALDYSYAGFGRPLLGLSLDQQFVHARLADAGGVPLGILAQRSRSAGLQAYFARPKVRLSSYALLSARVNWVDYRTYPGGVLTGPNAVDLSPETSPTLSGSVGFSTLQKPGLSVAAEDGIAVDATMRLRMRSTVDFDHAREIIVAGRAAKSFPVVGFARHAIAARAAVGITAPAATAAFGAGGNSGSSLEIVPGIEIGDSPRTFFARGFPASAQFGVRAAAASIEYRAPLALIGRGPGLLPVFLQKASVLAFADAAAAWCGRFVSGSWVCNDATPTRTVMASYGAEFLLDAALHYDRLYRFRAGVARPERGEEYAMRPTTFYLSLGMAF